MGPNWFLSGGIPVAERQFNRISCGYCLARLNFIQRIPSDAQMGVGWDLCSEMPGVIQPGYNKCTRVTLCVSKGSGDYNEDSDEQSCKICSRALTDIFGTCENKSGAQYFCRESNYRIPTIYQYGECKTGVCQINPNWKCNIDSDCYPQRQTGCWTCQDHQCSKWAVGANCTKFNADPGHCDAEGKCI